LSTSLLNIIQETRVSKADYQDTTFSQDMVSVPTMNTMQLFVGDSQKIENFYASRFQDLQLPACKIMAKRYKEVIESLVSSRQGFLFRTKDGAPVWWLDEEGAKSVRYREAHHLLKPGKFEQLSPRQISLNQQLTSYRNNSSPGSHFTHTNMASSASGATVIDSQETRKNSHGGHDTMVQR